MKYCIWLLIFLSGCCPHHYIPEEDPEPLPCFYVPENIRVALVLGSGGIRGMAHVGVIEELVAAGIPIDLIVGCSAGSIVGALYADNPSVEHIKTAVWQLKSDSIFDINLGSCRYGLSQGKNFYRILDDHLEAETFDELKIPLVVVATDLYSGELITLGSGDLVKSVQASCSIPFFFVPCDYLGRILVDGGVVNPVPARIAHDLGADVIIAVDLCELLPKTYPKNLFQVFDRSTEIVFMWQNQVCASYADFVIRPKTCGVGTFNDEMKQLLYESGKDAAKEMIPAILKKIDIACEQKGGFRLVEPPCYTSLICEEEAIKEQLIADAADEQ